jgi:hypothetical protein
MLSVDEATMRQLARPPWRFDEICGYLAVVEYHATAYRSGFFYLRRHNPLMVGLKFSIFKLVYWRTGNALYGIVVYWRFPKRSHIALPSRYVHFPLSEFIKTA